MIKFPSPKPLSPQTSDLQTMKEKHVEDQKRAAEQMRNMYQKIQPLQKTVKSN